MSAPVALIVATFRKNVGDKLPRASRFLRGWRKVFPKMSKMPWGMAVWCSIAAELSQRSPVLEFMELLRVELYFRVSELLTITTRDRLRTGAQGAPVWSVILFPSWKNETRLRRLGSRKMWFR